MWTSRSSRSWAVYSRRWSRRANGSPHRAAPRLRSIGLAGLERLALERAAAPDEEALGRRDELAAGLAEDLGGLGGGRAHDPGRSPVAGVERGDWNPPEAGRQGVDEGAQRRARRTPLGRSADEHEVSPIHRLLADAGGLRGVHDDHAAERR